MQLRHFSLTPALFDTEKNNFHSTKSANAFNLSCKFNLSLIIEIKIKGQVVPWQHDWFVIGRRIDGCHSQCTVS